jgi:hypothetical protein
MRTPDPTIVAMAAHEVACRRFSRAIDKCEEPNATRADQREYDAANVAERAAALALAKTLPTTKDGAKELLAYVKKRFRGREDTAPSASSRGEKSVWFRSRAKFAATKKGARHNGALFSAGADAVRNGKLTPHSL